MNYTEITQGYVEDEEKDIEVKVSEPRGNWKPHHHVAVVASGVTILEAPLTKENVAELRGETDDGISICASVFELIKTAANEFDNCTAFDDSEPPRRPQTDQEGLQAYLVGIEDLIRIPVDDVDGPQEAETEATLRVTSGDEQVFEGHIVDTIEAE